MPKEPVLETMQITYKLRLRDTHATELNRQAWAVNYVWNYLNQTQRKAARECRRWLSGFDLSGLTAGTSEELGLHSHTIQRVCRAYAAARRIHKKPWLRWRGRRALGWVPFNTGHVTFDGEAFTFRGVRYVTMHLREIPDGAVLAAGSFNADARGRWYLNVPVDVPEATSASISAVGIDLGLTVFAALSTGETIPAPRLYRASEAALAIAQRARKTKRTKQIHAKVANRRKDFLHKQSLAIVQAHGRVFVGNVSASKLAKTPMAKSVSPCLRSGSPGLQTGELSRRIPPRGASMRTPCWTAAHGWTSRWTVTSGTRPWKNGGMARPSTTCSAGSSGWGCSSRWRIGKCPTSASWWATEWAT